MFDSSTQEYLRRRQRKIWEKSKEKIEIDWVVWIDKSDRLITRTRNDW